jgi:D-alanine-D-alanine ligase
MKVLLAYNEPPKSEEFDSVDIVSEQAIKDEVDAVQNALRSLGHQVESLPIDHIEKDLKIINQFKPDLIFNLVEGYNGDAGMEMGIAGLWELKGITYTGNSALTLGLAQNKAMAKKLFQAGNILTPEFEVYERIPKKTSLSYPLIVKPSREDASLGITQDSIVHDLPQLQKVVSEILNKYSQPALVEQFIDGREFNISILGNNPIHILPISEIDFSNLDDNFYPITTYEAKWMPEHPLYKKTPPRCPAEISATLKRRLEDIALSVYRMLRGRDYGRVDVRMDANEEIYVLEYNPNPDISPDAGFIRSLKAGGYEYEDFVSIVLKEAAKRKANG